VTDRIELLGRLGSIVASDAEGRPLPQRLCDACRLILDVDGASITVEHGTPHRVTLCTTDDVAASLDDAQDVVGEGPACDALNRTEVVVATLDDDAESRWPQYTMMVRRLMPTGIVYAVPMRPGGSVLGVLSLYRRQPVLVDTSLDSVQFLADTVGAALLHDPLSTSTAEDAGPWSTRATVHQATGMVVAQLRVSVDDALAMLRAHAFAHNVSMGELAAMVVSRRYDFRED
jgi:transcriptional regulator with GAF, ATPase, and Fis domain